MIDCADTGRGIVWALALRVSDSPQVAHKPGLIAAGLFTFGRTCFESKR